MPQGTVADFVAGNKQYASPPAAPVKNNAEWSRGTRTFLFCIGGRLPSVFFFDRGNWGRMHSILCLTRVVVGAECIPFCFLTGMVGGVGSYVPG